MTEKKNIPGIRFKGFEGEWKKRMLFDNFEKIVDFRGRTPKKMGLDWSETGYLALSALNVKNGFIDPIVDAHYGNQELYDKWMNGNELHKGQVLFTTEAPMGNVAQIPNDNKYILSQRTIAFVVQNSIITEDFLAVLLGSSQMFYKLSALSSGGTAKGISQKSLSTVDVVIPIDIKEQAQIGTHFQNLDNLISQHLLKYNKLLTVKKAMLEKMFPKERADVPEIRFKGFNGKWKMKKLGEVATMKARIGWQGLTKSEFLVSGDYYLITGTDFNNGLIDFSNCHYINLDRYIQDVNIQIKNNDVLITKDGTIGKVAYVSGLNKPATLNAGVFVIRGRQDISNLYLYQYLAAPYLLDYANKQATGGTIKHLNQNVLVDFPIPCPSFLEQTKIGTFFQNLDTLITQHQKELIKLKILKKACLEKMFV